MIKMVKKYVSVSTNLESLLKVNMLFTILMEIMRSKKFADNQKIIDLENHLIHTKSKIL